MNECKCVCTGEAITDKICANETYNASTIKVKYHDIELSEDQKFERMEKIAKGDWVDMYAADNYSMSQFEFKLIFLGVSMEIPKDCEMWIAPRSSTFKNFGIIQTNSIGVVDNSYCGDNDKIYMPALAMRDTEIKKGDKICQFRIIPNQPTLNMVEVEVLGNEDRGGIGSTGTRK